MQSEKRQIKILVTFIFIQLLLASGAMLLMNNYIDKGNIFLANLLFYLVIFILPVVIYIWKVKGVKPFTHLRLDQNLIKGIATGLGISAFVGLVFFMKNKFQVSIGWDKLGVMSGVLLAGIFEEIPFRGFYLREIQDRLGFWKANLVTSFLFAIIHIEWVISGNIIQLVMLFIIGIWLGYIYDKTKSLWAPIIVHGVYNILTVMWL